MIAGEVRGIAVAHAVAGVSGIEAFAEYDPAHPLEPQPFLELQRARPAPVRRFLPELIDLILTENALPADSGDLVASRRGRIYAGTARDR